MNEYETRDWSKVGDKDELGSWDQYGPGYGAEHGVKDEIEG